MILFIVFLIIFFDQISKLLAAKFIVLNQSIPVAKNIFHLTLVHNRGAAFGILKNQTFFFLLVSCVAILVIFNQLKKRPQTRLDLSSFSLALILAGALGNFIDRLFLGYVVDFLDFRIWPVFNLADSAISIGAVLLGYAILRRK